MIVREVHIPAHNARFAVTAEQDGRAFVAIPGVDLAEILCAQEERQVGNDNCVAFHRLRLQIPASPLGAHVVKARVVSVATTEKACPWTPKSPLKSAHMTTEPEEADI